MKKTVKKPDDLETVVISQKYFSSIINITTKPHLHLNHPQNHIILVLCLSKQLRNIQKIVIQSKQQFLV